MLVADTREPKGMRDQCDAVYHLDKGDYMIMVVDPDGNEKRLSCERKTAGDFQRTLTMDGRLGFQLEGVDILIFEKMFVPKMHPGWWLRLHSALNGVARHTVVYYTLSCKHTIEQLRRDEKELKEGTWGTMRRAVMLPTVCGDENQDQCRVLMGLPGVGEKRAGDILKHFGTLDESMKNIDRWPEVDGVGPKTLSAVKELMGRKVV